MTILSCLWLVVGCGSTTTSVPGNSEGSGGANASGGPGGSSESGGPELLEGPIVEELRQGLESGESSFDHSTYDDLLSSHVNLSEGNVDYEGLKENRSQLDQYVNRIANADLTTLPENEQLALLINAYNAYTLELILDNYPDIDSIRDLDSPWSTENYEVGGHTLSLDQIEHKLIRPLYKDPRIHFAVNCAAIDCPYLADFAYTGDAIDEQLDRRTEAILSNEQFVRVEEGTLRYTRVMKWYKSDFVSSNFKGSASSIAQYIAPRTRRDVRNFIESKDGSPPSEALTYNWNLNDTGT